ncbi:hypothetical protein C7N43_14410 [Sphingobacteriales bacterium UPWRP_1]|nr:hypothetical protein BVG80_10115 [Sphingobacteriales bacterium TSM_CSM]PSJ76334.1 hypothetical protein C7N43_14410 [Sphingobacteriales bacterium UPWRP_1]
MNPEPWLSIFKAYNIEKHHFSETPFLLTAEQIKRATAHFNKTAEKEVRILCKQDTRESRPQIFKDMGLFILPVKNGTYAIIKGEGYVDVPEITAQTVVYQSQLNFKPLSSEIGNSEMQHLDYAYAASLIRSFCRDDSLVLTIRGRKYTPGFDFYVGYHKHRLSIQSVQTEIDAGYEGISQIVLIEAKNSGAANTIIRQLYYPYRQWQTHTTKKVKVLFFEKHKDIFSFWEFGFSDPEYYNSIKLLQSARFKILNNS